MKINALQASLMQCLCVTVELMMKWQKAQVEGDEKAIG